MKCPCWRGGGSSPAPGAVGTAGEQGCRQWGVERREKGLAVPCSQRQHQSKPSFGLSHFLDCSESSEVKCSVLVSAPFSNSQDPLGRGFAHYSLPRFPFPFPHVRVAQRNIPGLGWREGNWQARGQTPVQVPSPVLGEGAGEEQRGENKRRKMGEGEENAQGSGFGGDRQGETEIQTDIGRDKERETENQRQREEETEATEGVRGGR